MDFSFEHISSVLTMLLLISFLIITHELGHFWVAKKCGIRVERFGFGLPFGPTLWSKKFGETEYCIHAALFGGYVSFPDDNPDSPIPPDSPERFENKTVAQRFAVAIAGITVNAITGWVLMMIVIMVWGLAELEGEDVTVQMVMSDNSAAAVAGLKAGDQFREIQGAVVNDPKRDAENRLAFVRHEIGKVPNATVTLTVRQNCQAVAGDETADEQPEGPAPETAPTHLGVAKAGLPKAPPIISPCDEVSVSLPTGQVVSIGAPLLLQDNQVVVGEMSTIERADEAQPLRPGDRLTHLEGTALAEREPDVAKQLAYVQQYFEARPDTSIAVGIERNGKAQTLRLTPTQRGTVDLPMELDESGQVVLGNVDKTFDALGLLPGDTLLRVNEKPLDDPDRVRAERVSFVQGIIQTHPQQAVPVVMVRNGKPYTATLTPNENGLIGVQLAAGKAVYKPEHNPLNASWTSLKILGNWTVKNFEAIGGIFTGVTDTSQLSGPIGIVTQGGQMIKENGIQQGLMITAAISVILAVMNLLPIPALDGGHILFLLIEAIKGSPVRKETQEKAVQFGFMALLALMVFVVFNDINNIANPVFKAGNEAKPVSKHPPEMKPGDMKPSGNGTVTPSATPAETKP